MFLVGSQLVGRQIVGSQLVGSQTRRDATRRGLATRREGWQLVKKNLPIFFCENDFARKKIWQKTFFGNKLVGRVATNSSGVGNKLVGSSGNKLRAIMYSLTVTPVLCLVYCHDHHSTAETHALPTRLLPTPDEIVATPPDELPTPNEIVATPPDEIVANPRRDCCPPS